MNEENFRREKATILEIGRNNGYRDDHTRRIIRKHERKSIAKMVYAGKDASKDERQYVKIPYIGAVSQKVGRLVESETGKKVSFSCPPNLGKLMINCKDRISKDRKSGVYQLSCNDCEARYIGQTGRNFKTRIDEHRRAIGKNDCTSLFAQHLFDETHSCDFDNFKVLHSCNKGRILDRLETIEIKRAVRNNEILTNDIVFQTISPLLDFCTSPRPSPLPSQPQTSI